MDELKDKQIKEFVEDSINKNILLNGNIISTTICDEDDNRVVGWTLDGSDYSAMAIATDVTCVLCGTKFTSGELFNPPKICPVCSEIWEDIRMIYLSRKDTEKEKMGSQEVPKNNEIL